MKRERNDTAAGVADTAPPTDLFDLDKLRINQNFADAIGVKRALLTVPVRRPEKQWFCRVHPDEAYRLPVAVLEERDERDHYLVDPALGPSLMNEVVPMQLFTAINRQGVLFLWPVRLQQEKSRRSEWNSSAIAAANLAMTRWVRITADLGLGAYVIHYAQGALDEPEWPDLSFKELLAIAFKHRFIDRLDHDVLRRLRGEI